MLARQQDPRDAYKRHFRDRADAGRALAQALAAYAGRSDVRVLGLPRGGIPVAFEVAAALRAPLDVFLVRKLGVPWQPELAMGAIAEGGVRVLNHDVLRMLSLSDADVDRVAARETRELEERNQAYRAGRPPRDVRDCTVIVVDDGLATGASMQVAANALRQLGPARIVVAVPVASIEACAALRRTVDEVVCLTTPSDFHAVGIWYDDFTQTSDDEVRLLLQRAATERQTMTGSCSEER